MNPLSGKSIAIATHVFGTGPADALEEYARERAERVLFVGHAFSYATDVSSRVRRWERGRLVSERRLPWHCMVPGPASWAKDLVLTVFWGLRIPGTIDTFVGVDSLNAAAGLVLRRLGKARRVVFWTIDFVPVRFDSRLLNAIYHRFDRFCVTRCDETWNVSPRIEPARRERGISGRQRIVPIGAHTREATAPANPHQIVFVGHLLEKQGVQLAIAALPAVRERVPDARLLVVGDGPNRGELDRLVREKGVKDAIDFAGYVDSHEEVEERIAESAVGIAPYDPRIASFTEFADPGKIKNYLAAGVPVVTTPVVHSADELARSGAGVVVEYDEAALARVLVEILTDTARQEAMRRAAAELARESDWVTVFDRAFQLAGGGSD